LTRLSRELTVDVSVRFLSDFSSLPRCLRRGGIVLSEPGGSFRQCCVCHTPSFSCVDRGYDRVVCRKFVRKEFFYATPSKSPDLKDN